MFILKKLGMVLVLGCYLVSGVKFVEAQTYEIDAAHSTFGFAVKHLVVSTTRGLFSDFKGSITFDPTNLETFSAEAMINAESIDTKNEKRDEHLKKSDFFDVAQFPQMSFQSKKIVAADMAGAYVITGELTIKDVTKTIDIPVKIAGPVTSPFGPQVIGLEGEIVINRQDYNITWNKNLDSGGLMVADNVKVIVEIEAHTK